MIVFFSAYPEDFFFVYISYAIFLKRNFYKESQTEFLMRMDKSKARDKIKRGLMIASSLLLMIFIGVFFVHSSDDYGSDKTISKISMLFDLLKVKDISGKATQSKIIDLNTKNDGVKQDRSKENIDNELIYKIKNNHVLRIGMMIIFSSFVISIITITFIGYKD